MRDGHVHAFGMKLLFQPATHSPILTAIALQILKMELTKQKLNYIKMKYIFVNRLQSVLKLIKHSTFLVLVQSLVL